MNCANKILATTLALSYLTIASFTVLAQNKIKHPPKKQDQKITLGLQSGRELLFNSTPLLHSKQSKIHYGISKSLVLRKPLNKHFKIEAGVNYNSITNSPDLLDLTIRNNGAKTNQISLPVTIQYYFLSRQYRLRPYCGAGMMGCITANNRNQIPLLRGDGRTEQYIPQPDTKYITILFTQGVTFEINTKIQVSQAIHFIPGYNNKVIGIDMGVGYTFP